MTSQGHVTSAALKQANKEYAEAHPFSKLHTVNWRTLHIMM